MQLQHRVQQRYMCKNVINIFVFLIFFLSCSFCDARLLTPSKRHKFFTETGTWTAKTSMIRLTMCGGGGGGGGGNSPEFPSGANSGGNGGGASEYLIDYQFTTTPGTNYSVTIGSGGVGGVGGVYIGTGTNGTAGGNTSFGTLTVTGGQAGQQGGGSPGGTITASTSGTSTSYVVGQLRGFAGTGGQSRQTTSGGRGGTTPFVHTFTIIGTLTTPAADGSPGGNGTGYGCGGAGGGGGNGVDTDGGDGGDGSGGFVLIKY